MPNSPDFSSSFYSDSSDTGSLTGGMRQKFDTIHRHSRRTSDILGDIEEELHSSDNENSGNSSSSIIIEGTSNTDIPPLFNDSNSSSSDDSEIRSSSDDDIHARCRQIHIQNIRLRRKAEQDLLECRNERGLLEFNRDRIVNELEIAEDDIDDQNRIINILNQENLLLRNNIHTNNNRTGMAGYAPSIFNGYPNEDPEEFIDSFRSYLIAAGINIAVGDADRIRAHGLFETCLKANLGAVQGRTAIQLGVQALNRANRQAGNIIIPSHIIFDEDWSYIDGRPTDRLPNAPNSNTGNTVVVAGIRLGSEPVGRFYSNLRRLARLANIDEQQIRLQFLRGLSPTNQIEVRRLGLEKSVDELLPKLEEIERYTAEQLSGAYLRPISDPTPTKKNRNKDNVSDNACMTETDIRNLKLLRPSQMEPGKIYRDPDLRLNDQEWLTGYDVLECLNVSTKPNNISFLQALKEVIKEELFDKISPYLSNLIKNEGNDSKNADEELSNRMSIRASNKSSHRCSNCNRTGHNSRNCPRKKRKSKSKSKKKADVNLTNIESSSDTSESESDSGTNNSSDSESDFSSEIEGMNVNITRQKKNEKLTSSFDKGRNNEATISKPTRIDKSLQKIVLDMFDGILPVDLMISQIIEKRF
nr:14231_t:CDS:2 [Entrophospora candida]